MIARLPLAFILACAACSPGSPAKRADDKSEAEKTQTQVVRFAEDAVSLVAENRTLFPEVPLADLRALSKRVSFQVRENVVSNGREVDALNNGVDTIQVHLQRWGGFPDDRKLGLVFHQLLNIMKLEGDKRWISGRAMSLENRYAEVNEFECLSPNPVASCRLEMWFEWNDLTFRIRNKTCRGFPASSESVFQGHGFNYRYCANEDFRPGQPCRPTDGVWNRLIFSEGYRFMFSGNSGSGEMTCRPPTS